MARLSQLIDDVAKGDLSTSELSNAIDDVKSEVQKLRDAGLNDEAAQLEAQLEKLEVAKKAKQAEDRAQQGLGIINAAAEAERDKEKSSNDAAALEMHLKDLGLSDEADAMSKLRAALEDPKDISGAELEQLAKDATALGDRLRGMGKPPEAKGLAGEADRLAQGLHEAATAKLSLEAAAKEKVVTNELQATAEGGQKLSAELEALGLAEDQVPTLTLTFTSGSLLDPPP